MEVVAIVALTLTGIISVITFGMVAHITMAVMVTHLMNCLNEEEAEKKPD
ncbi:MAG: hypothetical protein RR446_03255 [Lachnospiraceae bacterium]